MSAWDVFKDRSGRPEVSRVAKDSPIGEDYRRKPPNQHKLGGDFHVLTRWATAVVADIFPLTEAEPTILTNRHRFGTDGCVAGKTNRSAHIGVSSTLS